MTVPWLPDGFHTVTANIIAEDAEGAIHFRKRAFGAAENYRLTSTGSCGVPDGRRRRLQSVTVRCVSSRSSRLGSSMASHRFSSARRIS